MSSGIMFEAETKLVHCKAAPEAATSSRLRAAPIDVRRRWVFDEACSHWSLYTLSFEAFCEHLSRLGYDDELPPEAKFVFLCAACTVGSNAACKLIETRYFPALRILASRFDARSEAVDEMLQLVRDKLFVGPRARIKTYRGRGGLAAWLHRVARSVILDQLRCERRMRIRKIAQSELGVALPSSGPMLPPDQRLLSQRDSQLVEQAVTRALLDLPEVDRQLLRNHFILGLGIDTLARLYGIDRSTAARRIVRAVRRVRTGIRTGIVKEFGISEASELGCWAAILSEQFAVDASALLVCHGSKPLADPSRT